MKDQVNPAIETTFAVSVNNLPIFSGSDPYKVTIISNLQTTHTITEFSDPEGSTIEITISNPLPSWIEYNPTLNVIVLTPLDEHLGDHTISLVITAASGETLHKDLTVVVNVICAVGCTSCFGSDSTSCSSCESHLYFHQNQCLDSCPSGTFPNDSLMQCVGRKIF